MTKENFIVISSFAKDLISHANLKNTYTLKGGPAFWIGQVLKNFNIPYKLITSRMEADVRIRVARGKETGTILNLSTIKLPRMVTGDTIIVSTIGNEFALKDLSKLRGFLALDIQGYARTNRKETINIPRKIAEKIDVLKATSKEIKRLSASILRNQKQKMLIITNGKKGFTIFYKGKEYRRQAYEIKAPDTIGAGDILFAAFLGRFRKGSSIEESAEFAQKYVESFLFRKSV